MLYLPKESNYKDEQAARLSAYQDLLLSEEKIARYRLVFSNNYFKA